MKEPTMYDLHHTANMNDQQRAFFYAEYGRAKKDEVVGVLFALFLGCFGIHRFYLGETGWGILYLVFSWTGIPAILGVIECFFMPARVRRYNDALARAIAVGVGAGFVAMPVVMAPFGAACTVCGRTMGIGAAFCPGCGAGVVA